MKNILIIYAHPGVKGHCTTFLETLKKTLDANKISYDVIDLYKEKFNPVLTKKERETGKCEKSIVEYQKKIKKADKLVFIHPIWWNGVPAILKGFFDRVLTQGFAFKYKNIKGIRIGIPVPLLKGKKAIIFSSSGSLTLLNCLFQGSRGQIVTRRDTLGFVGIKAKTLHIGDANILTKKNVKKIQKLIEKGLGWLSP